MRNLAVSALVVLAACGGPTAAVPIEKGTPCAFCRMTISDPNLAAEIVAPGEEPRMYDDIGCLANDLRQRPAPAEGRAFVADFTPTPESSTATTSADCRPSLRTATS